MPLQDKWDDKLPTKRWCRHTMLRLKLISLGECCDECFKEQ